jgi:amino acid ABC transporter substrate-binding protein, PAAT family (TC 3.A.1.3.-)
VKTGATSVAAVKKHMPQANMRMFDDEAQALQEVLNGRAHAMVASAPFPEQQAIRNKDKLYLPLGGETFTKEPIGFAIRKTDPDFLNFLNNWVLVAESEGWLAERYDYWFKPWIGNRKSSETGSAPGNRPQAPGRIAAWTSADKALTSPCWLFLPQGLFMSS